VAKPELASPMKRQSSFEKTSDKTAAAFVRRVLVSPHLSTTNTSQPAELEPSNTRAIDTSLPPLTSINEVDLQLYALIAILVKDCIHSWYSRFSSDQAFVDDLLQVIAHCTRALEERLRHMDLEQLLLDEIPAIIEAHITSKYEMGRVFLDLARKKSIIVLLKLTLKSLPAISKTCNST